MSERQMQCCAECIGDKGLKENTIPFLSTDSGDCGYCGAKNQALVNPSELKNNFELLANIYKRDKDGKSLVDWFKDDWAMFPSLDNANAKALLSDILDDGEIVREKFSPSELCYSDRLHAWETLRTELMHENRYFPQTDFDEGRFRELLSFLLLSSTELPLEWHRARIQPTDIVYSIDKMGAPPKRLATQGRANPSGIPYLYLSSTANTSVSEIRPHTGEYASVADFEIPQDLNLIDLRSPRTTISPFLLGDENEVALLRGDVEFLVQLGHELTRPVLPRVAAIDYIPSQYICEFIKRHSHHGVIYSSSLGEGINLALFDPDVATPGAVKRYLVSRVSVTIEG